LYGDSSNSASGSGAIIWLVPDAPVNLANNLAVTNGLQIGITFQAGASDGSTPVLDYKLWYAEVGETYEVLEAALTSTSYTTSVTLNAG
jgi:hypothetical protein